MSRAYVMKPEDNATTPRPHLSAEERAIRLYVLSRVCVISVPANVLADISDPAGKVPIEVDEGDFETLRQKSTDRALAGSTRSDQSNLLGVTDVTRMIFPPEVAKGLLKRELESEATAASPVTYRRRAEAVVGLEPMRQSRGHFNTGYQ